MQRVKWKKWGIAVGTAVASAIVVSVFKMNPDLISGDRGYLVAIGVGITVGTAVSVVMQLLGGAEE